MQVNASFTLDSTLTIRKDFQFTVGVEGATIYAAPGQRHFRVDSDVELDLGEVVFDGNGNGGGFEMAADVMLTGGIIQNCRNINGGGVASSGTLTVDGTTFKGNVADDSGGAVFCDSDGGLVFLNGVVTENFAVTNGAGLFAWAGADLILAGGIIADNGVSQNGGVTAYGGGVYAMQDALLRISGCEIRGNQAVQGGGVFGRDIEILGGAIIGNQAEQGGGVHGYTNEYDPGYTYKITMTGGIISGNTATEGGGLYTGHLADLQAGTIAGNHAVDGGGVWTSDLATLFVGANVGFDNNTADTGWYMEDAADIALHEQQVLTETVSEPFIYAYNNYDISYKKGRKLETGCVVRTFEELQAAIDQACPLIQIANDITMTETIVLKNKEIELKPYERGEVALYRNAADRHFIMDYASLRMTNITLDGSKTGGGIEARNSVISGGTVTNCKVDHGSIYAITCDIRNCIIANNEYWDIPDISITIRTGGIWAEMDSIIDNCIIYGNKGHYGGGLKLLSRSKITNSIIYDNVAEFGGGIYAFQAIIEDCEIYRNRCSSDGAGVRLIEGVIRTCAIYENHASGSNGNGGGIVASGNCSIEDCDIYSNTANHGGGFFLLSFSVFSDLALMKDCTVHDNAAIVGSSKDTGYGGGVAINTSSLKPFQLVNCEIFNNRADTYGGGVYVWRGLHEFIHTSIHSNVAGIDGDDIYYGEI